MHGLENVFNSGLYLLRLHFNHICVSIIQILYHRTLFAVASVANTLAPYLSI